MCNEFRSDRYFRRLYSSRLRLSRRVLRAERRVSLTLSSFLDSSNNKNHQELASDLEWLFSWKLKTSNTPEFFWCDGVADIALKQTGKYEFQITAMAWVGPEANTNVLKKVNFIGRVNLKPSGKGFKRYKFIIRYSNEEILLKKT